MLLSNTGPHKLLLDAVPPDGAPSGYGTETATTTTETQTSQTPGDTNTQSTQDNKTTETSGTTEQESNTSSTKSAENKEADITGYGDKPADESKPLEGDKSADEAKPLELDLKGLPEDFGKTIQDIAKNHSFTKEQAQALIDAQVKRNSDQEAAFKTTQKEIYSKWEKELKEDPDFGGEKFAANVHSVNKLLSENFPSITKSLTGTGKRLSPTFMKELKSLADKFYGETQHTEGVRSQQQAAHNPWDVYGKEQNSK